MQNLCHFDVEIGGILYPKAEEPLVLEPILAARQFRLADCPYRELRGFRSPTALPKVPQWQRALMAERPHDYDPRVIVPRLSPVIRLARDAGKIPMTIPLRFIDQRGKGAGAVVLSAETDLEAAPDWLAVEYKQDYPRPGKGGPIVRRVKGAFPIKVSGGLVFDGIPDDQAAVDHPDGTATCPDVPEDAVAVIVPHSGPIVREYERRGLIVFVTSRLQEDGTVELHRVA